MISGFEIVAVVAAGITIGFIFGFLAGADTKRPPRPRKHSHEWSKWENHLTIRLYWSTPDEFTGYRYHYVRTCATCGYQEHDTKEVR